jgi:hypothetical protein
MRTYFKHGIFVELHRQALKCQYLQKSMGNFMHLILLALGLKQMKNINRRKTSQRFAVHLIMEKKSKLFLANSQRVKNLKVQSTEGLICNWKLENCHNKKSILDNSEITIHSVSTNRNIHVKWPTQDKSLKPFQLVLMT